MCACDCVCVFLYGCMRVGLCACLSKSASQSVSTLNLKLKFSPIKNWDEIFQYQICVTESLANSPIIWYISFFRGVGVFQDTEMILGKEKNLFTGRYSKNNSRNSKYVLTYINGKNLE